jgi:hypothetical protein
MDLADDRITNTFWVSLQNNLLGELGNYIIYILTKPVQMVLKKIDM